MMMRKEIERVRRMMNRKCEVIANKILSGSHVERTACGKGAYYEQGESICLYHIKIRNNRTRKKLLEYFMQGKITQEYYQERLRALYYR